MRHLQHLNCTSSCLKSLSLSLSLAMFSLSLSPSPSLWLSLSCRLLSASMQHDSSASEYIVTVFGSCAGQACDVSVFPAHSLQCIRLSLSLSLFLLSLLPALLLLKFTKVSLRFEIRLPCSKQLCMESDHTHTNTQQIAEIVHFSGRNGKKWPKSGFWLHLEMGGKWPKNGKISKKHG